MNRRIIILIASTSITILLFLYALWVIPQWQVAHLSMEASEREVLTLENEYRKTLTQIIGGVFVIFGVYLAWRRVSAAEKTVEVAQEGQITERFTSAVDQIGNKKLEIRLGGIYALERIAKESEKDHWPIMEVLTAYVRVRSPRRKEPLAVEAEAEDINAPSAAEEIPSLPVDIQVAMTVIGRRIRTYEKGETQPLNLSNTDLRNGDFSGANLAGANLQGTNLQGANLQGANLAATNFQETNLSEANLLDTNLSRAYLHNTNCYKSDFARANLSEIRLYNSNLNRVIFVYAKINKSLIAQSDLTEARFLFCELSESVFEECNFKNAEFLYAELTNAKFHSPLNLTVEQIKESRSYDGAEFPAKMQIPLQAEQK